MLLAVMLTCGLRHGQAHSQRIEPDFPDALFKATGKPEKDRFGVALLFARKPVEKMVVSLDIMNFYFRIPAGADNHGVTACSTFEKDAQIISFMPQMACAQEGYEVRRGLRRRAAR